MTGTEMILVVGQLSIGIGGIGSLLAAVRMRAELRKVNADSRKSDADAVSALSGATVSLIRPLQDRADSLAAELDAARQEVRSLRVRIGELSAELIEAHRELKLLREQQQR
jgi:type IV secretory pathway VirB4 component